MEVFHIFLSLLLIVRLLLVFLPLFNGCIVLVHKFSLIHFRGYKLLHGMYEGNSYFLVPVMLGLVLLADQLFEEEIKVLDALLFGAFERLTQLLLL